MKSGYLLDNENLIEVAAPKGLELTNLRIQYNSKDELQTMFINRISTICVKSFSKPYFISLGLFFALLSFIALNIHEEIAGIGIDDTAIFFIVFSVFSFLYYFLTRKKFISIESIGGKSIDVIMKSFSNDKAAVLINKIEKEISKGSN